MTDTTDTFPAFDEAATLQAIIAEVESPSPPPADIVTAQWNANAEKSLVATALPPEARARVEAQMRTLPADTSPFARQMTEADLVRWEMAAATRATATARQMMEANEVGRAIAEIEFEVQEADRERTRIQAELAEVSRFDPRTGEPVLKYQDSERKAREFRLMVLEGKIKHLAPGGNDATVRLEQAKQRELEKRRKAHEAAFVQQEAARRADEIIRDERVEALARAKANMRRHSGGQ